MQLMIVAGQSYFFAVESGENNIVEYFVNNGANINIQDNQGYTPLIYATIEGYEEIVKYLLSKGADVSKKTSSGYTAKDWAEKNNQKSIVKLFNL